MLKTAQDIFQKETPVDAKVMQYMITRAALLLRSYPTTLEQDQATMKDSKVKESEKQEILKVEI